MMTPPRPSLCHPKITILPKLPPSPVPWSIPHSQPDPCLPLTPPLLTSPPIPLHLPPCVPCGAVADKQQGGSSGVVIAVVVCVLLLLLMVALIYFLNKKNKLPCGNKKKKEVWVCMTKLHPVFVREASKRSQFSYNQKLSNVKWAVWTQSYFLPHELSWLRFSMYQ